MAQQSDTEKPDDSNAREVVLPGYLLRQQDGIFVDMSQFPVGSGFLGFVDRLFSEGWRFQGLDYSLLTDLLYDRDAALDAHGSAAKVRLALDIVDFPPLRKALYKAVKVDAESKLAEYLFEPVFLEAVSEQPVYGEPGADGVALVVGAERKTELVPTSLDPDEFIAEMWLKGVRYGIDVAAVAGVISRHETARIEIARYLDATEGSDAEIEEASDALRRDNSPKRLANGKADLRRFQNRFPQISGGSRLLKKKKRVLGKPGFKVSGAIIEPPIPADFDLLTLAGEGTRVENQGVNEFIVATREGFLSLDVATNHISVTEKIENKGGVSARTTGDLSLAGDEFIEHGEVQEGRVVEGKNMTFRSAVYGEIVSHGGLILLEGNLSGGSARSRGGTITSNARAFNSVIESWEGGVTVKYAESSLIMGETVNVERAVNCEIIATRVEIGSAEGCGVAGKVIRIASSSACRDKETIVSMLVPSLLTMDAQIRQVQKSIADGEQAVADKEQQLARIKEDGEVGKYLALAASIETGSVKLNPVQQANWHKMSDRFAATNAAMKKLDVEMRELSQRIVSFGQELAYLMQARERSGEGIDCAIAAVAGDTRVRTMVAYNGTSEFAKLNTAELRARLREQGFPPEQVFTGDEGSFDWHYELPPIA
ncbi:MAG: FapA family protein [Sideroxyarcus sp.]|nr:FapA family protein [Sideroxyarcus sp.]